MEDKSILLINDMAGYGKVALSTMIPMLSHMKYQIYNLPTALVSNTLDYGKFDILETTDYMRNSLKVWEDLGFSFDAVCTGFIVSEEQTKLVSEYCRQQKEKGTAVFVDPIMGDEGKLYNGVTENTIEYMRQMCGVAHIIMPNYTEAAFLADLFQGKPQITVQEAYELAEKLHLLGAESVVITSADVEGQMTVIVYDGVTGEYKLIPYTVIPVRFPGTGDIFSSVLVGNYLRGIGLEMSVRRAMRVVEKLIAVNKDNLDKYKGIPIERYLEELDNEKTED